MYGDSIDEYIRSILGYPSTSNGIARNTCNMGTTTTTMDSMYNSMNGTIPVTMSNSEIEECYPEIYKIVYPMVNTACRNNTKPITKDTIENMTNEIYFAVEGNGSLNVNLQVRNLNDIDQNRNLNDNDNADITERQNNDIKGTSINKKIEEKGLKNRVDDRGDDRGDDRQFGPIQNRTLRDLIRILIIRELLGRPGFPGVRPPVRPPFPGRPPRPPMRPPFPGRPGGNRNYYDDYLDIYED